VYYPEKDFESWYRDHREELMEELDSLIRIRSTLDDASPGCPYGERINTCLQQTLTLFEDSGFTTGTMDNQVGFADLGEGGIVLGIPTHIDVVPENGPWKTEPWKLTLKNGRMYGRGVQDNKGAVIQTLAAVRFLQSEGFEFQGRLRFLFGTNEENGMKGIRHYREKGERIPFCFVPDSAFPIINAEKGIINFRVRGRGQLNSIRKLYGGDSKNSIPGTAFAHIGENPGFRAARGISIAEENGIWIVSAEGESSHAADPEQGDNAVTTLFRYLSGYFSDSLMDFYNAFLADDFFGEKLGIAFSDKESGKLTLCPGHLRDNSINLDIRYPVTMDSSVISGKIADALSGFPDLEFEKGGGLEPLFIPEDDPTIRILAECFRKTTGYTGKNVVSSGGGTYARAFEKAVAFGPVFPDSEGTGHQPDEYMSEEDFSRGILVYANAVSSLMDDIPAQGVSGSGAG
jgi:succinyl-diaminopimelate desuccinylase